MAHEPGNPPNFSFLDIHKQEREEIGKRRAKQSYPPTDRYEHTLVGLALSGGGIRSATFCLGFLQGLHELRLLRVFDYLSTVSGGGYLGGWWSAWLSRSEESLRDISDEPLLSVNDIYQPVSMLAKIAEAADPVCQALHHQLENDIVGRHFLQSLSGNEPIESSQLSQVLAYHLNTYITKCSKSGGTAANKEEPETIRRRAADLAWEARVSLIDTFPYELRGIFPPPEKIEPDRLRTPPEQSSDGSRCAWEDPIHHLRLFANYLTPRKGLLSADTWRAISVIARNLAFTWLILLPLLIGVMLLGQAYFLLNPNTSIAFTNPGSTAVLRTALIQILIPVGVLLISGVLVSVAWLLCNRDNSSSQDSTVQTTCLLALVVLIGYAVASITPLNNWFEQRLKFRLYFFSSLRQFDPQTAFSIIQLRLLVAWAILLLGTILFMWYWKLDDHSFPIADSEALARWKREVRRSRFSRAQAMLLVLTAIVAVVLLLSWISCALAGGQSPFTFWKLPFAVVPVLSAIAGSIFTALRATPVPNADPASSSEPTRFSKVIFAATPPLVVAVLAVIAAWFSHWLLGYYIKTDGVPHKHFLELRNFLRVATIMSIALCMALAIYEMQNLRWYKILRPAVGPILFVCLLMINLNWAGQAIFSYGSGNSSEISRGTWTPLLISVALAIIITLLVFSRVIPRGKWKWRLFRRLNLVNKAVVGKRQQHLKILRKLRLGSVLAGVALSVALAFLGYLIGLIIYLSTSRSYQYQGALLRAVSVTFVGVAGGLILFRLLITRKRNHGGERVIELYFLGDKPFGKRPIALWLTASISLMLPIVLLCVAHWAHWVRLTGQSHQLDSLTEAPMIFPICIGALLVTLMWLRSLVVQKAIITKKPIVGWSGGILDWLLDRVPQTGGDHSVAYQLLALAAVCLAPIVELTVRMLSLSKQFATSMMVWPINWKVTAISLFVSLPLFGISIFKIPFKAALYDSCDGLRLRFFHSQTFLWILASFCILWAFLAGLLFPNWVRHISEIPITGGFATILLPVATGCFLMVLFEFSWGRRDNRRSLYLIAFAYSALASIFFFRLAYAGPEWQIVPGMLAAICVWVGALGWMVDPNAVSMHQFYKGRLVRAYLGASNVRRLIQRKTEITETVAGDDAPLKSLRNCERGGPYHLINTTLNLVAGRDLATAQRSASSFVLSQRYCGSARTQYCSTEQYMNGQLTLGTAVAASGAAVSPNMGAKKPTAALAMLMTLLNVRLGYWAPTPNREGWNSSQPRLWPFYLVREFLSQTNDLSDYCYLTDGGHFDNTGLYSLIERGCRYIVLVDCGADPKPCFEDFGEAIRRCRIDFGTEIELSLDPFLKKGRDKSNQCFAVGKICFAREHLLSLEHTTDDCFDEDSLTGTIVYFKPTVLENVTPDVRQYRIENGDFPQQGTTNQWFDEAQFESYRRLGEFCANRAFDTPHVKNMSKSPKVSMRDIDKLFKTLGKTGA